MGSIEWAELVHRWCYHRCLDSELILLLRDPWTVAQPVGIYLWDHLFLQRRIFSSPALPGWRVFESWCFWSGASSVGIWHEMVCSNLFGLSPALTPALHCTHIPGTKSGQHFFKNAFYFLRFSNLIYFLDGNIGDLHCRVSFWCTAKWFSYACIYSFLLQVITSYWI